MKRLLLILTLGLLAPVVSAEESAEEIYARAIQEAEVEYRVNLSKELLKADQVIVYLVDFEMQSPEPFIGDPFGDGERNRDGIPIATYGKVAPIIGEKILKESDRDLILSALAEQIAEPYHTGGPWAHFPNHGIRVFRDGRLIFQSTFSWATSNFPFAYPVGSCWLDSNDKIESLFRKILPLPEELIDRLDRKHPSTRKRIEQTGAGQAATGPETEPNGDENPKPESKVQPQ